MLYRFLIAFTLFLSLSSGIAFAGFEEGQAAYKKKDWGTAVRHLLPLARNNHDGALLIIGKMYADGDGVPVDLKKAFELFDRSAHLGNPEAMVSVAAFYSAGQGTEKNMRAAFEWFRKASELNYSLAQFSLGVALAAGDKEIGIDADIVESYKWLMLSSRNTMLPPKFKSTALNLARHERSEEMTAEQRAKGDQALRIWKPKKWDEISETSVYWDESAPAEQTPETAPDTTTAPAPDNNPDGETPPEDTTE